MPNQSFINNVSVVLRDAPKIGGMKLPAEVIEYFKSRQTALKMFRARHNEDWSAIQSQRKRIEQLEQELERKQDRISQLEEDHGLVFGTAGDELDDDSKPTQRGLRKTPGGGEESPEEEGSSETGEMSKGERAQHAAQRSVIPKDDEPVEETCPSCGEAGIKLLETEGIRLINCPHCGHKAILEDEEFEGDPQDDFVDEDEGLGDEFDELAEACEAMENMDPEFVAFMAGDVVTKDNRDGSRPDHDSELWDAAYSELVYGASYRSYRRGQPVHIHGEGEDGGSVITVLQRHLANLAEEAGVEWRFETNRYGNTVPIDDQCELFEQLADDTIAWAVAQSIIDDLSDRYQAVVGYANSHLTPKNVTVGGLAYHITIKREEGEEQKLFLSNALAAANSDTAIKMIAEKWSDARAFLNGSSG